MLKVIRGVQGLCAHFHPFELKNGKIHQNQPANEETKCGELQRGIAGKGE